MSSGVVGVVSDTGLNLVENLDDKKLSLIWTILDFRASWRKILETCWIFVSKGSENDDVSRQRILWSYCLATSTDTKEK